MNAVSLMYFVFLNKKKKSRGTAGNMSDRLRGGTKKQHTPKQNAPQTSTT